MWLEIAALSSFDYQAGRCVWQQWLKDGDVEEAAGM